MKEQGSQKIAIWTQHALITVKQLNLASTLCCPPRFEASTTANKLRHIKTEKNCSPAWTQTHNLYHARSNSTNELCWLQTESK